MQSLQQSQQPSIRAHPSLSQTILRSFLRHSIRFAPFFLLQENTVLLYRNCCHHLLSCTIKTGVRHSSRMVFWSAICLSLGNKTNTTINVNFNINGFYSPVTDKYSKSVAWVDIWIQPVILYEINTGSPIPSGVGEGGISYNGLHREVVLKRGTFFRLQVYERVKESVFRPVKGPRWATRCILWLWTIQENVLVTEEAFAGKLQAKFSLHFSLSLSFPPKGSGYCFNS